MVMILTPVTQNSQLGTIGMHADLTCKTSLKSRQWQVADADTRQVQQLMQQHGLPELVARMLALRGIASEQVTDFLNPTLKNSLPDPMLFKEMRDGAERLASAIVSGEKIAVFGDYDVDGATSSALLLRYLRALGAPCVAYIPDRIKEGYGPNAAALLKLQTQGYTLAITVDCGTLAFDALSQAHKAGLDVVVVDHHQAEARLPNAVAIINPNRLDESGAHRHLAAVGVTFLLLVATQSLLAEDGYFAARQKPDLLQLLDLVAVGTVCDVVPLTGVNRAFVSQGLKILAKRNNAGLTALMDAAGIHKPPTASTIGFALGPRINAGGRIGRPDAGVELLACDDMSRAQPLAQELDRYNAERRAIESVMVEEAVAQAEADIVRRGDERGVILVHSEAWHPGIVGIVASRLKDRFARPTAVIALDGTGFGRASARSLKGFDFGAAVIAAVEQQLLIQGGGHMMAAGFSVEVHRIEPLRQFLSARYTQALPAENHDVAQVEAAVRTSAATVELAQLLNRLAPFGAGNPEPLLMLNDAKVVHVQELNGGHIKLMVTDALHGGEAIAALAFRIGDTMLGDQLRQAKGKTLQLIGRLELDHWQGRDKVCFKIEDVIA